MTTDPAPGRLLLLGDETESASIDRALLETAEGEVLVLPTGAAYERPDRAFQRAATRFGALGASVRLCPVLSRADAGERAHAQAVASARCIYLCGSSPLHLRSVLKDSQVLQALLEAWASGAALCGAGGGATVLSDPMVDPRGGAFTVGIGLVRDVAVRLVPANEAPSALDRTLALAPVGCALVALGQGAGLRRESDGTWRQQGPGALDVYVDAKPAGLVALAGKALHGALEHL